jgi:hypothetical protein
VLMLLGPPWLDGTAGTMLEEIFEALELAVGIDDELADEWGLDDDE